MNAPKYLKMKGTPEDHPYHIWTPLLAARDDMEPFTPGSAGEEKVQHLAVQASASAVTAEDAATIAKIAEVTNIKDLYPFQVEGRSAAVENAINARGMALLMKQEEAAEPPPETKMPLYRAKSYGFGNFRVVNQDDEPVSDNMTKEAATALAEEKNAKETENAA